MDAGPTQPAEDGVVGGDLDGRHVGAGLPVPALGGDAGGGDLDEVLGHPTTREDRRRARPGRAAVRYPSASGPSGAAGTNRGTPWRKQVAASEPVRPRASSQRPSSWVKWTPAMVGLGHVLARCSKNSLVKSSMRSYSRALTTWS